MNSELFFGIHYSSFDPQFSSRQSWIRDFIDARADNLILLGVCASGPAVGAQSVSCTCWNLWRGCRVTGITTATILDTFLFCRIKQQEGGENRT